MTNSLNIRGFKKTFKADVKKNLVSFPLIFEINPTQKYKNVSIHSKYRQQ